MLKAIRYFFSAYKLISYKNYFCLKDFIILFFLPINFIFYNNIMIIKKVSKIKDFKRIKAK